MKKLNEKQKRFCEEYIIDLNATQSAIRSGYSVKTATEMGYENLTKPHIQQYIAELKKERLERTKITQEEVLKELYNWAFSDITETINLTAKEVKELPKEIKRLVTKFKRTTQTFNSGVIEDVIELCFVSKEKAMEMITKHIGFYEKDNEQIGNSLSKNNKVEVVFTDYSKKKNEV